MRITTTTDEGVTFLAISGDIDLATSDEVREAGEKALSELCSTLRIDLSEVGFLDSTGLGALVSIRNAAGSRPVVLDNATRPVLRVLEISGLDQVFTVEPALQV
jgi:anti-sigma B factor antagonist